LRGGIRTISSFISACYSIGFVGKTLRIPTKFIHADFVMIRFNGDLFIISKDIIRSPCWCQWGWHWLNVGSKYFRTIEIGHIEKYSAIGAKKGFCCHTIKAWPCFVAAKSKCIAQCGYGLQSFSCDIESRKTGVGHRSKFFTAIDHTINTHNRHTEDNHHHHYFHERWARCIAERHGKKRVMAGGLDFSWWWRAAYISHGQLHQNNELCRYWYLLAYYQIPDLQNNTKRFH